MVALPIEKNNMHANRTFDRAEQQHPHLSACSIFPVLKETIANLRLTTR